MWELLKFVEGKEAVAEGIFDSLGAAATRIVAIEEYPTTGFFWKCTPIRLRATTRHSHFWITRARRPAMS